MSELRETTATELQSADAVCECTEGCCCCDECCGGETGTSCC